MENEVKPLQVSELSLDEVLAGLHGFGIEECEQVLTIKAAGRTMELKLSNIPTEAEMEAILAGEGYRDYSWIQRVKCEILSRAITWVNGKNIKTLSGADRMVTDPKDGVQKDIQVVLRNLLLGMGQEIVAVLWKVLCVHAQRIEDRLTGEFPESAILTEVEKRLVQMAEKEIEEANQKIIRETMEDLYRSEGVELPAKPEVQQS